MTTNQVDCISEELYEWFGTMRLEFIKKYDMRHSVCHLCKNNLHMTNFYSLLEWGYCSLKCAKKELQQMKERYLVNTGKPLKGTHDWIWHILLVNSKKLGADKIPNYVKGESHNK